MLDLEIYLAWHNCRTDHGVRTFCQRAPRFYSGATLRILRGIGAHRRPLAVLDEFWKNLGNEWGPYAPTHEAK